ncbi:MAG: hypothetical protein KDD34_05040 [Bdellovibrionales bacterium]|nr:hypothetical protein [Bdellovibrionales bacterium]
MSFNRALKWVPLMTIFVMLLSFFPIAHADYGDRFDEPEIVGPDDEEAFDNLPFSPRPPRFSNDENDDEEYRTPPEMLKKNRDKNNNKSSAGNERFGKAKDKIIFRLVEDPTLLEKMKAQKELQQKQLSKASDN